MLIHLMVKLFSVSYFIETEFGLELIWCTSPYCTRYAIDVLVFKVPCAIRISCNGVSRLTERWAFTFIQAHKL